MNWKQALFTVFLGNVLVLIPMLLNAHAGAQYGIPFQFLRAPPSAFSAPTSRHSARPRRLRLVRHSNLDRRRSHQRHDRGPCAFLGQFSFRPAICFVFFWLLNVLVILRGIETIRFLQGISLRSCSLSG